MTTDTVQLLVVKLERLGALDTGDGGLFVEATEDGLVRFSDSESKVCRALEALKELRKVEVVSVPDGHPDFGREVHEAVWGALNRVAEVALCDQCEEESGESEDGAVETEDGQRMCRTCHECAVELTDDD